MTATSRKAPAYVMIVDEQGNPVSVGDGDMKKSVYDTNNNGIVDSAETVDWSGVENKPEILDEIQKMATQADSTATDVEGMVTDFNALLAKLKAAGIMA